MRLASPSHNSYMELGKSVTSYTDSNGVTVTRGNSEEEVYGNSNKLTIGHTNEKFGGTKQSYNLAVTEEFFVGAKFSQMTGVEVKTNIAKEINKNVASRDRKSSGHIYYGSSAYIKLEGPGTKLTLDSDVAELKAGSCFVTVENGGDVLVKSAGNIEMVAGGDIHLKGNNIILNGNVAGRKTVENPSIKATK